MKKGGKGRKNYIKRRRSELCGINGYFAGKNENNCACGARNIPLRESKFKQAFFWEGGGAKNSTFSRNILP